MKICSFQVTFRCNNHQVVILDFPKIFSFYFQPTGHAQNQKYHADNIVFTRTIFVMVNQRAQMETMRKTVKTVSASFFFFFFFFFFKLFIKVAQTVFCF